MYCSITRERMPLRYNKLDSAAEFDGHLQLGHRPNLLS